MISVWKPLGLPEPLFGLLLVKLTQLLATKGEPDDVLRSSFRLLYPFVVRSSLEACCRPVPRICGLYDVKFGITFKSQSHNGMTTTTASSPHDDWVKPIKSHTQEEIA